MKLTRTLAKLLLISAITAAQPSLATQTPANNPRAIVVEDVSRADFAGTIKNLKEQLETDGWNIVAEINLGERLAKKNVVIPGGLVILELASGKNAVPLLKSDATRYVSALMPCSVSIYGMSDGRIMVSRMNAGLMAGMMEPKVAEVMQQAAVKLDATIGRALAKSAN